MLNKYGSMAHQCYSAKLHDFLNVEISYRAFQVFCSVFLDFLTFENQSLLHFPRASSVKWQKQHSSLMNRETETFQCHSYNDSVNPVLLASVCSEKFVLNIVSLSDCTEYKMQEQILHFFLFVGEFKDPSHP